MATSTKDETLSQVWFAGVHSNVGGGYPDDFLANVSLNWMMAEAADCDLRFKSEPTDDPDALKQTRAAQDKDGRLYDLRSGLGGYYRYGPRNINRFFAAASSKLQNKRVTKIHESAIDRIQLGAHLYAPIGLPAEYGLVTAETRDIRPVGTHTCETADGAKICFDEQKSIWNAVWRRRAIYFLTVFASVYLALYPLIRESYAYQELATRLRIVADAIKLIGNFLPSGADRWIQGYARDPAWFLLWAAIIAFLIWYGSTIKTDITSRMRRIWDNHLPGRPSTSTAAVPSRGWRLAWFALLAALTYVAVYPLFSSLRWLSFLLHPNHLTAWRGATPSSLCALRSARSCCSILRLNPRYRSLEQATGMLPYFISPSSRLRPYFLRSLSCLEHCRLSVTLRLTYATASALFACTQQTKPGL